MKIHSFSLQLLYYQAVHSGSPVQKEDSLEDSNHFGPKNPLWWFWIEEIDKKQS